MSQVVREGRLEALPAGRDPGQRRLAERARTDRKARAKLLAELYPLVKAVAWKQQGLGVDFDDLVQAGMEGALKAIQRYTPMDRAAFTTYAYKWIHGEMRTTIAWHRRAIRVPKYRVELAGQAHQAREGLYQKLGRIPTDDDVAAELGVEVREIWRLAAEAAPIGSVDVLMEAAEADDLDAGRRASESQIRFLSPENQSDLTGEPERITVQKLIARGVRKELRKSRGKVEDRDRNVMWLRHVREYPRWAVGAKLGITVDAVRWSEDRAEGILEKEKNLEEIYKIL